MHQGKVSTRHKYSNHSSQQISLQKGSQHHMSSETREGERYPMTDILIRGAQIPNTNNIKFQQGCGPHETIIHCW